MIYTVSGIDGAPAAWFGPIIMTICFGHALWRGWPAPSYAYMVSIMSSINCWMAVKIHPEAPVPLPDAAPMPTRATLSIIGLMLLHVGSTWPTLRGMLRPQPAARHAASTAHNHFHLSSLVRGPSTHPLTFPSTRHITRLPPEVPYRLPYAPKQATNPDKPGRTASHLRPYIPVQSHTKGGLQHPSLLGKPLCTVSRSVDRAWKR